jgi:nucleoside-diphosphate-sugar epimerase
MLKNKTVLITGATGFIGANLTRRCQDAGAETHIFTRTVSNTWRLQDRLQDVRGYDVDLLDSENVKTMVHNIQPEVIFHTATYGGYPFQKEPQQIVQANLIGTLNLLDACAQTDFEIFVNSGSSSEYAIKNASLQEDDLLTQSSFYGISKAAATLFCKLKAQETDLPITTLRLFSPYGYYEDASRLIPSVILACLSGQSPQLSSPQSVRDFVFIEDVIDAYMKVVEQPQKAKAQIINIGSGQQHAICEITDKIIELTRSKEKPQWHSIPNPRIEPKMWQADISKAKELLGWQPAYALTAGLEKTVTWFRNNESLYR